MHGSATSATTCRRWPSGAALTPRRSGGTTSCRSSGQKLVEDLEFADGERVHRSITAPYRANRTYETLRRVLNLCRASGDWIDRNPVVGLEVNDEQPRNDYFTAAEVKAISGALPHTESGDVIRVLLLSGPAVGEVLGMRWEQLT